MRSIYFAATLSPLALLAVAGASAQLDDARQPTGMETVVVTGMLPSIEAARAEVAAIPGGATLIDMEPLQEQSVGSLADALRYVPGIWAVSDTGNDNLFFSSRGSNLDATDWDMNGIKLLQDGLPITTADGNNHNRSVDPLAARYAVVARGANALGYGASTLGGAINFVTPTARERAAVDVAVNGGSHGQRLARVSLAHAAGEMFDGMATLETKRWDGYRDHNEQERVGFYGNAGWQLSERLSTRFYATYIDNDQALPGLLTGSELEHDPGQASAAAVDGRYQLNVLTRRLANRTTWQIDADRRLDAGLSIERQSLFHPIVWVAFDDVEIFSLLIDTEHRDVGVMLRYGQRIGDHDLLFGVHHGENEVEGGNYRHRAGVPAGLTTAVNNAAATTELFAMDRWQVSPRTTVTLAAQAVFGERDVQNLDVASGAVRHPRERYRSINPRIGAVRSIGRDTSVYGNLSRLFEPPTNYQLEDNVAGGGAALDAMSGTVLEVGTRGGRTTDGGRSSTWDVSLYYAEVDDEILSVEDPSAPGTSLVTNIDRTLHAGLEAVVGATWPLAGGRGVLAPLLSLTINEFSFDADAVYGDNTLPAAPEHFVRGELIYRAPGGFYAGPTLDVVGRRWADFANTYRVDSYSVLGLRLGWSNDRLRVFAEARNLGDERYVVSHSVRNRAASGDRLLNPGEPRSMYVGFQLRID